MAIPGNLHEVVGVRITLSIIRLYVDKSNVLGGCITMYCVLVAFKDSLFAHNQLQIASMDVLAQ